MFKKLYRLLRNLWLRWLKVLGVHEKYLSQAWDLHRLDRDEEAIIYFDKALEINPKDLDTWYIRGSWLKKLGMIEESVISFIKASEVKLDDYGIWCLRASTLDGLVGMEEEVLACYNKALEIRPDDYELWNTRADYLLFNLDSKEEAISSYYKALEIRPNDYELWLMVGSSLESSGKAEAEEVLPFYYKALEIRPDNSKLWQEICSKLRILGRQEEALFYIDKGLEIKPDDYELWFERGLILIGLGREKEAVSSFDKALEIRTEDYKVWFMRGLSLVGIGSYREALISFSKSLEIKPDHYETWNMQGFTLHALNRYEEAIMAYDMAIEIRSDDYEIWCNRSFSALFSLEVETLVEPFLIKGLIDRAIGSRSYDRSLVCCDAGIAHCDSQSYYDIKGRGKLHQRKGDIYFEKGRGKQDYSAQFVNAANSYEVALNEWKKDTYKYQLGEDYLEVLFSLIRVCIELDDREIADTLCREGTDLYDRLLEISDPKRQEKLIRQFSGRFRDLTVSAYLLKGKLTEALEIAENDKNQCLAWLFSGNEIPVLGYSEMQELLDPKTAIIFWHISDYALTTFLLLPNATAPLGFSAFPVNGEPEFETWQRQWQTDYQKEVIEDSTANFPKWIEGMTSRCDQLRQLLNIDTIQTELDKYAEINQLLLVPHRTLHLYPLHSLFDRKYLITHVPSLQIALELKKRKQPQPTPSHQLLAIANPKHKIKTTDTTNELETTKKVKNLRFAEAEGKAICQAIPNSQLLTGETATIERLTQELSDYPTQILHFSCHGKHDPEKPEHSQLYLSQNDTLTFKQIPTLPLITCQLAYLSACETGMTANKTIRNEYIGLSSAFLYAGVPVIVSTLWSIEDVASALLSIAFYDRYLHPTTGGNAPLALKQAQAWLRDFDRQEYERIYADPQWQKRLSASQWLEIETALNRAEKPYLSPYYWAGYYTVSFFNNSGNDSTLP